AVGNVHLRDMALEWRVVALGRADGEGDEVPDIRIEAAHAAIIFGACQRADRLAGTAGRQATDAVPDEVNARRFERFQKARRQTESDDIVRPAQLAAAGAERDDASVGERLAFEVGEQDAPRLLLVHEGACENMAVAGAMLERDAPLPA